MKVYAYSLKQKKGKEMNKTTFNIIMLSTIALMIEIVVLCVTIGY